MHDYSHLLPTLIGALILVAVATAVLFIVDVRRPWSPAAAVARGALQLAAISVVLTGVITSPIWVAVALGVMFVVAAFTSTRRIGWSVRRLALIAGSMATGVLMTMGVVFSTGALEATPRYLLAIGGIIIGGAMSIATLTGRRLSQSAADRWDEVEGWLAIGATPRQATLDIARNAIGEALVPTLDQTKTTGLVTLPGAFVGAIFGGVAPIDAGRFQLVVLAGIIAAGVVTSALVAYGLAPAVHKPTYLAP